MTVKDTSRLRLASVLKRFVECVTQDAYVISSGCTFIHKCVKRREDSAMQQLYDPDFELDDEESEARSEGVVGIVELVNRLQDRRRRITKEEREKLASWMGWGPVARAFEPEPVGKWAEMSARLRMLLGPKGFEAAQAATPHSFFTDRYLADGLWQ